MFYILFGVLGAGLLVADQLVKAWTVASFSAPLVAGGATLDKPIPFLPGLVELTRARYVEAYETLTGTSFSSPTRPGAQHP